MTTLSTARGRGALAVSTVFTCLATALVIVRIYTRAFMVKQMGSDDYAILIALVRIMGLYQKTLRQQANFAIQAFSWAFFGLFVGGLFIQLLRRCIRDPLTLE